MVMSVHVEGRRVLVLGDETILGLDVANADTFAARLQDQLRAAWRQPVEVINAAVPGDCPLLAALRLKHELLGLQPDIVICHFDMSDVADDYLYRRSLTLGRGDVNFIRLEGHLTSLAMRA